MTSTTPSPDDLDAQREAVRISLFKRDVLKAEKVAQHGKAVLQIRPK
jgi:hypothetical protein